MTAALVVRSLALGLAAGSRASLGVAAPLLGPAPGPVVGDGAPGSSRRRPAGVPRALVGLAVAAELVGDKLPTTPSRLDPPGPDVRAGSGAAGGLVLGLRRRASVTWTAAAVVAGAAGGVVGTGAGAAWRSAVARRGWPDLPAALAEDAVALGLAAWAARA